MLPRRATVPRQNHPIATWTLILINGVIFLFVLMLPMPVLARFFYLFGIVPARFTHPDWAVWAGFPLDDYWPFLTSMFLHGGWLHIIGNIWTLWIFGDNVEDRMGPIRFSVFYVLCGLTAAIVHCLWNPRFHAPDGRRIRRHRGRHGSLLFPVPHVPRGRPAPGLFLSVLLRAARGDLSRVLGAQPGVRGHAVAGDPDPGGGRGLVGARGRLHRGHHAAVRVRARRRRLPPYVARRGRDRGRRAAVPILEGTLMA